MMTRAYNLEKEYLWIIVVGQTLLLVLMMFFLLRACTAHPVVAEMTDSLVAQTVPSIEQDMLISQAETRIANQDYQGGLALLDVTIAYSQPTDRLYAARANAFARIGELENAMNDFQQAIALNPTRGDYRYSLCYLATELGQIQLALSNCDEAIQLLPNTAMVWNSRCYLRAYFTGDYVGAVSDCNQAILLNPNHPYPYNNRARAYLMSGSYQEALNDATRSIQLGNPYLYLPLTNRGTAYAAVGNANAAIADYQAAIQSKPDYSEIYARLGEVYRWQNQANLALQAYCRYLQLEEAPLQFIIDRAIELGGCA
jgi:tetratricopeptide (TPR) repeat protein